MQSQNKLKILVLIFISSLSLYGQDGFPIGDSLYSCLNAVKPFTIDKAMPCIQNATEACELELTKTYKELLALIDDKKALTDSQKKWVEYRDAQILMSKSILEKTDKWKVEKRLLKYELTKQRLFELQALIRIYHH